MSLYLIVEAFRKLGSPNVRNDDFYDQLSRRYTLVVLGSAFLIVSTTQLVGHPINCFALNLPGNYIGYTNWVCWTNSSFYWPFDKRLPESREEKPKLLTYYQWVPFILLFMMLLFYIPGFVWRNLNKLCGIDTKRLTKLVVDMDQLDCEKRANNVRALAKHIDTALLYHRDYHHGLRYSVGRHTKPIRCCVIGSHSGTYLVWVYLFTKCLYIINVVGQFFLLNMFMGHNFTRFAIEFIQHLWRGKVLESVEHFPRVTTCDVSTRVMGDNIHNYLVQCVLPINIYNEKVFLFIWFWLVFVTLASIYGVYRWIIYFTPVAQQNFIRRFLKANNISYYRSSGSSSSMGMNSPRDQGPVKRLDEFVKNYCRPDGMLLLRMINENSNDVVTGEIICALWDNWKMLPQIRSNASPESDNGGQMIGLGVKDSMKQNGSGEGNEKLLPPVSGILS